MDLKDKVVLITGASRGVGSGLAVELAKLGAKVACAARSTKDAPHTTPGTLDETIEKVKAAGGEALAVPTDLAKEEEVVAMVQRTYDHFGRLDVLVNNAAITFVGDIDLQMKRQDLIYEVDFRAPFIAIREAIPHMREAGGGHIINVSSFAALNVIPGLMMYGVTKLALERLTIDVAEQLRDDNIQSNVFRIDLAVASEGFVANQPGMDHSSWEPVEVAAEGMIWMLSQPPSYTGNCESMRLLREREGIMESKVDTPSSPQGGRWSWL